MPGFDRTGPIGTGPMTGGRRGLCGSRNTGRGLSTRGWGFERGGRGIGRCRRPVYEGPYPFRAGRSREDEIEILKEEMRQIQARIGQLESKEG